MNKTRLEIMVGFFVLLAISIFFVIIFFVSGVYFLREGYHVKATFNYTAGLEKGANVRLSGIPVGEVNRVYLDYDEVTGKTKAMVDIWLKAGTHVNREAKVYIFGAMALNETTVEFMTDGEPGGPILQDGDTIVGIDPVPMELFTERAVEMVAQLEEITDKVNRIIGDEETVKAWQTMIVDMSEVLRYTNQMLTEKGDTIEETVINLDAALLRLNSILETIDEGDGTVGQLVRNDDLYQELRGLVREIKLHPWRLLKRDKKKEEKKPEGDEGRKKKLGIF